MSGAARVGRALALVAATVMAAGGCAGLFGRRGAGAGDEALGAWQTLVEGRRADAERAFERRLAAAPGDIVALFGRGTIAYERGDGAAAMEAYAAVVAAAAREQPPGWGAVLAPVAAARALALDEDVAAGARGKAEAVLLAAQASGNLPWPARLELARLGDHVARRAGDVDALVRGAAAAGCARAVFEAGSLGPLPRLDLDATRPPALAASEWRPAIATGCRITAASWDGRGGAEVLRAAVEVAAGAYDLVLDYAGEARLAVDGGAPLRHGSEVRYGPRASATRVRLAAGRHQLEIRIATLGGRAELALLLLPGASGDVGVRFVDPRAAGKPPAGAALRLEPLPPPEAPSPARARADSDAALADYCAAFSADRIGDADRALAAAARLQQRRRFALGLALAGAIVRNDPTRPATFARDAGRTRLRAALAIDGQLGRAWQTLAAVDLEDDRTREAIEDARAAARVAPGWWAPELVLSHALRARGLDWDADRALDRAAQKSGPTAAAPCLMVEALLRRADDRRDLATQARLEEVMAGCDAESEVRIDRLRARGELAATARALRAVLRLAPDRDDLAGDLALVLWAQGRRAEALSELASLVARYPRDPLLRVRLADAQAAAGQGAAARETVRQALLMRPDVPEVRRAARVLAVPLPVDAYRVDGRAVIRAFEASARHYAAPAVVVLDRAVARIFPDGAQMILTHEIVRVESKDAIDRWGEVQVPSGAEILTLRTHKPDGSTREPEEIAGKEAISAADLAIGDYVEWETLETKPASDAFAPGFLGERFYFQSFDAPLDRSEYLLVTPAGMKVELDSRAGAPPSTAASGLDGTRVATFARVAVPQLFAERSSVPPIEYVPSVRASSRVTWPAWARFLEEQLYGTARASPPLRELAQTLAATARGGRPAPASRARLAAVVVQWVTDNVEAADDLRDPASFALARGRGNRLALVLALARELGLPARPVLARSRLVADADADAPPQELDDFGETLVELDLGTPALPVRAYADLRLRHAAFGYLPPGLDGARTLTLPEARFGLARSMGTRDQRTVDMTIRLDDQGGGVAVATEELTGWPALEWAELVDRFGSDRAKLRQDFEQRWLGVNFPGARLRELEVDIAKDAPVAGQAAGGTVRVRYSFASPQLAQLSANGGHEMKLQPTFFRSQPGRRFATEPQRSTTLVLGFDVPFRLTATVELPRAARLVEAEPRAGAGTGGATVIARKGGYRFFEERSVRPGSPDVLVLRREAALPLMRVPPQEYAGVAADLRRVDGLEQQEIRIRLRRGAVAR